MHRTLRIRVTLILTVMAWLLVVAPAAAYIDPGSMSVIFQSVIAGVAAAGTMLVVSWNRVLSFLRRDRSGGSAERSGEQD